MDEIDQVRRIHRGEKDVLYFGMEYFSEDVNPGNADNLIPAGVNVDNAAHFHKQLCDMLEDVSSGEQQRHIAYACPRQSAKTAWLSNIFLVHEVVYQLKRYIVLFSETTDVAGDFITWGRYQLKLNDKLREDFGEVLYEKPSMNELDNKYEYITTTKIKVEAKGLGTQTRGLRHGATRPDLFVLDDLESKESTNTPELIEKSKSWFREEMLPALAKDGLCVYLGTILCYGSLLDYVVRERRDFESRKFSAIETWSKEESMWNEWRKIYRSDDPNAADSSYAYFKENDREMLAGTKLLWPEYWSYYEFMILLEENGVKAFNQEYQNEPTDAERQVFKPEGFIFFDDEDLENKELSYYGGIDIAMGKTTGDYTAIITVARNTETNVCYVVDAFMERVHPDTLIEIATQKTLEYQYEALGVEAQFAQEFIADKLAEELQRKGYPGHARMRHIKQRTRKALRIEALLPDIQNGKLRFHKKFRNSQEMAQFEMYPMHAHDDFPDAVQMAYSTALGGTATIRNINKRMR